jgi:hypothetical protein
LISRESDWQISCVYKMFVLTQHTSHVTGGSNSCLIALRGI